MENSITKLYSEKILDQALERYSIKKENTSALGGFESYIYAINRGAEQGILRIAHSIRRSPDLIRGELDWINYLYRGGVGVARPWKSDRGEWVELIDDGAGGFFLASAFEKARGETHRGGDWSRDLLWEYGNQVGRMHHLTVDYVPGKPEWKRPEWDAPIHHDVDQFIPSREQNIRVLYRDSIRRIKTLPVECGAYGLIHQDAHQGNFFVDQDGKITLFDFDDSSYSWFVEDIALVLFYAVMGQEDPKEFTAAFLDGFMPGYFSAYPLELKWFQYIPWFMKMRELDLYAVIHRSFDVENLEDPWCIWYLDGRKERLLNNVPYLDFDFEKFDFSCYQ